MNTLFSKKEYKTKKAASASASSTESAGFTLIEIIVSLGIFTVVAVVATGAFLKVIDANKKSQALKTTINNVNFALETMTRELRVGSNYYCFDNPSSVNLKKAIDLIGNSSCASGGPNFRGIAFVSSKTGTGSGGARCNLAHAFLFESDGTTVTIKKAEQPDCNNPLGTFIPIISPDIIIADADWQMKVTPATDATGPQPKVFIHFKGYSGTKEKNRAYFDIQTTVSQRSSI